MSMIAAIYARRSNEQKGVATSAKSVTRQKELAQAFAAEHGWTVDPRFIFEDDGIGGAEFEKRPGFMQMMSLLKPRAPFDVLIISEQKSLGRESYETNFTIKRLGQAGVDVWAYMDNRSLMPKNYLDKGMNNFRAMADEAHREDTSRRVTEAHIARHGRGHVVGGRVFGYKNVDVIVGKDAHGRSLRSHVARVIDKAEEAVVVRIFELYADGYGLKRIARMLNDENAPAPKPFVRKDSFGLAPAGHWVPSTVRGVLLREDYRGVYVWNKSRKRDEWGAVKQTKRPESEWKRTVIKEWRIISDELWDRVVARRQDIVGKAVRFTSGRLSGRPPKHAVVNLLAGLATCGICKRGMVVETYKGSPGKPRTRHYVCNHRRMYGDGEKGCSNGLRMPVDVMHEAVLQAIEEHALTPEAVELVIQLTERDDLREHHDSLERECASVDKRLARLVDAVADGGEVASVMAKIRELESRKSAITDQLANLRPLPRLDPKVLNDRLDEWRRLLRQSTTQARVVLQRVLAGRIVFTPKDEAYTFVAPTRFDRLFRGIAVPVPAWMPTGTEGIEHISREDTFDADYGVVLQRAQAALLSAPTVMSFPRHR